MRGEVISAASSRISKPTFANNSIPSRLNVNTTNKQIHIDSNVTTTLNKTASDAVSNKATTGTNQVSAKDVAAVKSRVMLQLNGGASHLEDSGIASGYESVFNILEKTVAHRERHSLMLVGPRSCGKSTIVNKALDRLEEEYSNEFLAIHLNSSIHSDDNTAVREIARQLDFNTRRKLDEDGGALRSYQLETTVERKSIHETFANILNVLSISLENAKDSEEKYMPLVFVIDEFEKFTSNHKQTLLYNLLDMSQNSDIPITVIGLTTKINAKDHMEKRVNSRFSQRIITISPTPTFPAFLQNAMSGLLLNNEFVESMACPYYGRAWNESVKNKFEQDQCNILNTLCLRNFNTTKNYREMNNVFKIMVSEISLDRPYFDSLGLSDAIQRYSPMGNLQSAVNSLSDSELILLVAAAKWAEKFDSPTLNFNLAFAEYKALMKESDAAINPSRSLSLNSMKVNKKHWSKKALRNCWEVLFKCNLLIEPVSASTTHSASTERRTIKTVNIDDNAMVLLDITLDELNVLVADDRLAKKLLTL
ncbi:ORC4 [Candida margitis]|uniref:ORC4 n=1 Tax=Candida margitis TaxID=1775924 RepID=UPI002227AAE3|nr:ORC4 [Candida margitis]KAI5962012.1 ORC4 [Candida margitis]